MGQGLGQGSIGLSHKVEPAGPPFPATAADNGLSVDPITGHIVLGDPLGMTGPADLLNAREIFCDSHDLVFSQRNISGFEDWEMRILNNFFHLRDTVSGLKGFGVSVDFAGNTGIYVSSSALEAGYIPPFLRFSDNSMGGSGKIQFNAIEGSMEITDDLRNFALAVFPSGNVAIQDAEAADPGNKFTVRGDPSALPLFMVTDVVNTMAFVQVDPTTGQYGFGDIDGYNGGTRFQIDDSTGSARIRNNTQDMFLLDQGNNIYQMGEIGNTYLEVDGSAGRLNVFGDVLATGILETAMDIVTGDPGSGPANWKLGSVIPGAVALDATQSVEVEISGIVLKLALAL